MIQSVDRAARILAVLSTGHGRLGVSELSTELGLAKGTVHGLLRTLQAHGLVEQDPETDKYQLGASLLALSNSYLGINELRSRSLAWAELLAARAKETVHVGMPHGDGVLVVHHVFRPDASLQILAVGEILPMHASALGKALLAHMAPENLRLVTSGKSLAKLTAHTLTTSAALRRDLDTVRARGRAVEREEAVLGEGSIGAPIFNRRGTAIGAIGIAGPLERLFKRNKLSELGDAVVEAARGISRDLGSPRGSA